jgi:peptidyl-prolyl cis-trans isomerase D
MSNSVDSRRVISYVFIFALALLFALEWGPGSRGCDRAGRIQTVTAVATVNGTDIPLRDFQRAYGAQLDGLRRQGVPTELARQFGMHKQVLDQLVNGELLAQAAESRGVAASDADLLALLKKQPEFQKDGQFDFERYQEIIRNYEGTTEVAYEAKLRRQLSAQRMLELVESSVMVSDDEVKAKYQKEGDTAKATFVRFAPTMFADKVGAPKKAEVEAWVKAHEADIAAAYAQNKASYFVPEKVKARQILLRVERDATPEKKAEIKLRAENLRKELVDSKKPFAELATQYTEDPEGKKNGGDLGLVERLALPQAFADVLFALKAGEITAVVESPLGFHVGLVEDKKASEQKPLEAVHAELASQLFTREKAKELARVEAQKAWEEVKKGKKLSDLFPASTEGSAGGFNFQAETKPQAKETGEFNSSADAIPQLGASPEAHKAIFGTKEPGLVEQLVTVGDAVVVIDERKSPSDADFATQKAQLQLEAVKGKQFEAREAFMKALRQVGSVVTNDKAVEQVVGANG